MDDIDAVYCIQLNVVKFGPWKKLATYDTYNYKCFFCKLRDWIERLYHDHLPPVK
jgi:hypothetical protein